MWMLVQPHSTEERVPIRTRIREENRTSGGLESRMRSKGGGGAEVRKKSAMGATYSLLRLSNPEKAPLVSSIVPEMSLWSSSLWRAREKRGMRKRDGRRRGPGSASTGALRSPVSKSWVTPSPLLTPHTTNPPTPPLHLVRLCSANRVRSSVREEPGKGGVCLRACIMSHQDVKK